MAATNPRVRSLYRSLLRELPPRPILSSPRSPMHQMMRDSFADPSSSSPPSTSPAPARRAVDIDALEQFAAYLGAQRQYVTLLERYNPGIGMDEQERVRLTARRVGMDLPKEYGQEK